MSTPSSAFDRLEPLPASEIKKRGWKGVMRLVSAKGPVVITNHHQPEAVVVPIAEYERLQKAVSEQTARIRNAEDTLREQWTQRLASLNHPRGRNAMDTLLEGPLRLRGTVKAGDGW